MIKKILLFTILGLILMSCAQQETKTNPFFAEWDTPFGTPPFDQIKEEHYMPAFKEAMKKHKTEIDAIIENTEEPTFSNTIEAMDYAGVLLTKVSRVFAETKTPVLEYCLYR